MSLLPPAGSPKLSTAGPSEAAAPVKAFSPDAAGFGQQGDMGAPALAGAPAGSPAGLVEDEAAPLRFKGTQPVRRGRTSVPGWCSDANAGC
jgi:hypothetical protein